MRNSQCQEQDGHDESALGDVSLPLVRPAQSREQLTLENPWERIRHPYVTSLQQWIDMNA